MQLFFVSYAFYLSREKEVAKRSRKKIVRTKFGPMGVRPALLPRKYARMHPSFIDFKNKDEGIFKTILAISIEGT